MSRLSKILLGGIVVAGFLLRFGGLSHDLWEGLIYHPDSAKQMRVVESFLHGQYFIHVGNADWDGYPYFFPHLLEYSWRLYEVVTQVAHRVIGVPRVTATPDLPDMIRLCWMARIFNALLSTAVILVAWRIGVRSFGHGAGLLAALFLALSPIDVVACHYEGADTSAAFFAAVAVLFAFRIYDDGRPVDYVLGTFFATCALAAKYHAGMSLVPILVAHVLRARSAGELLSRASLRRLGLVVAAGLVSLPLTMPSLASHFTAQVEDILAFFRHLNESTRKRIPQVVGVGKLGQLAFSVRTQLPVVAGLIGPALSAVMLVSPLLLRRGGRRLLVLLSMPLVYLFFGISFRPGALPVYHTLIMPLTFVIGGAALAALAGEGWPSRGVRASLAALLVVVSAGTLLRASLHEDYFFYHRDTRRLAQEWTRENVPASFALYNAGYGFELDEQADPAAPRPPGALFVTTSIRSTPPSPAAFRLKGFVLEDDPSLPIFRNPTLELFLETPLLRNRFIVPPLPRRPSENGNDMVLLGGPEFYRSEKVYFVGPAMATRRTLVSEEPLEEAILFVQNGAAPGTLSISFGWRSREIRLDPAQSTWVRLERPLASFPSQHGRNFYRLAASTDAARVRVTIATTDLEKGVGFYEQGAYAEARPWLVSAARATGDPSVAAMAVIASRLVDAPAAVEPETARLCEPLLGDLGEESFENLYGRSPWYLATLDYITTQAEGAELAGFDAIADPLASAGRAALARGSHEAERSITTHFPMLGPGYFALTVRARSADARERSTTAHVMLTDAAGRSIDQALALSGLEEDRYVGKRLDVRIPYFSPEWKISLRLDQDFPLVVDQLDIRPDLFASFQALGRLLRFVRGDDSAVGPDDFLASEARKILAKRAAGNESRMPPEPNAVAR